MQDGIEVSFKDVANRVSRPSGIFFLKVDTG